MSRPVRFVFAAFLASTCYLCFFASLYASLALVDVTLTAWGTWLYQAAVILMYMLLTLTIYGYVAQFWPQYQQPYEPEGGLNVVTVGALMLIIGLILVIVSYLNLWAAGDYFAFQACQLSGGTDCERTAGVVAALAQRYIGYGAAVLSVPVMLVGLLFNGVDGWG
jgi:hypothetical protein